VKQLVSFPGIIHDDHREATCTVLTTNATVPESKRSKGLQHTDYSIRNVSVDLPNGQYLLVVKGETIPVTHRADAWFPTEPV